MTSGTLLQELRHANSSFVAGVPRFLDPDGEPFIVLACIDPRLTGFLEPALGLPRNRALVVRSAGNQSSQDALRSIATGVYLKGVREVFVVGHTDCALANFSVPEVTESFRRAGVPRSAFGNEDLRVWFGAFHDIKANVLQTVESLRKSGVLPGRVKIHGIVLGIQDGKLEVVCDGDLDSSEGVRAEAPPTTAAASRQSPPQPAPDIVPDKPSVTPPPLPQPEPAQKPVATGVETGRNTRSAPIGNMFDAVAVFRDFFSQERKDRKFQEHVAELRAVMKREKNSAVILRALQKTVIEYEREYPDLPAALAFCMNALEGKTTGGKFIELMRRLSG
jgi:carbonic anhydrase